MDDETRAALQRLIEERGEDYAGLSRLLGRNAAYIQQYIKRGSPKRLAEADRRLLARYFGVDEALLGGPAADEPGAAWCSVPRLDVGAAAGAGAFDGDERAERPYRLRSRLAAADGARRARTSSRSSAWPAIRWRRRLADGDDILVDRGDGAERLRDGIYVLRIDDALVVKRLALNPAARTHLDPQRQSRLSRLARLRSRRGRHRRPGGLGRAADRLGASDA